MRYKIKTLENEFSVCLLDAADTVEVFAEFSFFAKTDEELSLVCETRRAPAVTRKREDGWRALRIDQTLDFSLIGILAEITGALARAKIGVFAVSTYRTDYIFVKKERWTDALETLSRAGFSAD